MRDINLLSSNEQFLIYPFQNHPVQLVFEENIIKLAIKTACSNVNTNNSNNNNNNSNSNKNNSNNEFNCLFVASPMIDDNTLSLVIDDYDTGRSSINRYTNTIQLQPTNIVPGSIYIPTKLVTNGSSSSSLSTSTVDYNNNQNNSILYANAIRLLISYCTSCSSIDSISNLISVFSSISYKNQQNTLLADSNFDMITLSNRFIAHKIQSLSIFPTGLSKALQANNTFYTTPKSGFCTLKDNKDILFVIESDPKANTLPLCGIWISGIKHINHPLTWSACIRYMFSQSILKRLNEPHEPFIVVHFANTHKRPDFYKVTTNQKQLEFTMFSGQDKLITTKTVSSNATMGISKTMIENRAITVDLIEVKDGFKLKLFLNGLNDALKQQQQQQNSSQFFPTQQAPIAQQIQTSFTIPQNSMLNLSLNEFNEQIIKTNNNDLPSIRTDSGIGGLYHSVSDISELSDDDSSSAQLSYSKSSTKPSDDSVMSYSSASSSSGSSSSATSSNNTQSMIFGIPRNPPSLVTNFTSKSNETTFKKPVATAPNSQSSLNTKTILKKSSINELHSSSSNSLTDSLTNTSASSTAKQISHDQSVTPHNQLNIIKTPSNNNKLASQFDQNIAIASTLKSTTPLQTPLPQQQQQLALHSQMPVQSHNNSTPCCCQPTTQQLETQQQQQPQLIQTPLGFMTSQQIVDLLLQKTFEVQTLQEQVNLLMAHHYQQQQQTQSNEIKQKEAHIQCDIVQQPVICEASMQTSWINNNDQSHNQHQFQNQSKQQEPIFYHQTQETHNYQTPRQQQQRMNDFNKTLTPDASTNIIKSPMSSIRESTSWQQETEKCKSEPVRIPIKSNVDTSSIYMQKSIIEMQPPQSTTTMGHKYSQEDVDDDDFDETNITNYDNVFKATLTQLNKFGVALPPEDDMSIIDNKYTPRHMISANNTNTEQSYYVNTALLPKVQYESLCLDDYNDRNMSIDMNSLAMKYLKDEQLTRVAKNISKQQQQQKTGKTNLYNQLIHEQDENDDDSDMTGNKTLLGTNNMSLASKQYFERYGLLNLTKPNNNNNNDIHQSSTPHLRQYNRSQSNPCGKITQENDTISNILYQSEAKLSPDKKNNTNDDDEIWLFGTPPHKSSNKLTKSCSFSNGLNQTDDKFSNSYNEMQIRDLKQQQQGLLQKPIINKPIPIQVQSNKQVSRQSDDDLDDLSHILDIENLKKLPKLL